MRIRVKPRSRQWTMSYIRRSAVLVGVFVVLSNIGFVLAQGLRDPDLLRASLNVSQFPRTEDLFMTIRQSSLIPSFGYAILILVLLSLGHYFVFGPKDMSIRDEQDAIPWWNLLERIVHAVIAVAFIVLLISGLAITFGRYLGGGSGTLLLRTLHEYSGFVFTPCLVILTLIWVRHAIPRAYDMVWFARFGGYLGYKGTLKSEKFNAGQKLWYWVMVIPGVLLAWSGFALFYDVGGMMGGRFNVLLHFFAAIPLIIMFIAHLYMTTLGTRGAFMGMIHGRFSKSAAKSYHSEVPDLGAMRPAGSD